MAFLSAGKAGLLPPANTLGSKKRKPLKRRIYDNRLYFAVFAVPFTIMYLAYAFFSVHPYGDNSVLVLDLNGQYVYYYEAFRDAFWGDGSFIYNWSRNLSGEMFGIFGYYFASPFMLIICLLPRTMMCGAIELVQLLKIGTAAVTFAFFMKKTFRAKDASVLIFSTCYALMSYMIVELMDPMWLDGLIYLPLIVRGVMTLVDDGKMLPLIIPLALMFIAHFYIGYMVAIFTLLYFLTYLFLREKKYGFADVLSSAIRFAAAAVTAVMCAACVLLPVVKSLSLGKLDFSEPDFSLRTQFNLLEFFIKLFPMSYDTVNVEGLPMIFSGTLTVFMLPIYYLNKKIGCKEKIRSSILCAALIVSMYIAPIDLFWHGMQAPNWLNYRYSFILSFMFVYMAARTFNSLDGVTFKALGGSLTGIVAFLIYAETQNYEFFGTFSDSDGETTVELPVQGIIVSLIALAAYFAIIGIIKKARTDKGKGVAKIALCAAVCLEMGVASYDTLLKIDEDVVYSNYSSYEDYMTEMREVVDKIQAEDTGFYRMEKTFNRTVCDPIGMGYAGISHSSSTMNTPALLMLKSLGYGYGGNYTVYNGSTYVNDLLFNIKYLIAKDDDLFAAYCPTYIDEIPSLYQKVSEYSVSTETNGETDSGNIYVYENPYASSYAYMAADDVLNLSLDKANVFENQNDLLSSVTGLSDPALVELGYYDGGSVNLATENLADGNVKYSHAADEASECHIDYVVDFDTDGPLYMYLPSDYEHKCNVWYCSEDEYQTAMEETGGEPVMEFAGSYFEGDDHKIMSFGDFKGGDSVRIRITVITEAYWSEPCFYTLDTDAFKAAAQKISDSSLNVTSYTSRSLEGEIDAGDGGVMLTTIPYEEGWQIEVDGVKTSYSKAADSLIAIELSAGEHTISMTFMPRYYVASIIISVLGVLICAVIFVTQYKGGVLLKKLSKKRKAKE